MKTIAKILLAIAVLWSLAFIFKLGNSFAAGNNACSSDNWSWSIETVKYADGTSTNEKSANFEWNNKSSMVAKISGIKFMTESGKLVKHYQKRKLVSGGLGPLKPSYIKPNESTNSNVYFGKDFPWDIVKKASLVCSSITISEYEDERLAEYNKKDTSSVSEDFNNFQTELYQGCYENADQLTDQRAKEYCRCVTLMITDKYEDTQILEIGEKSEAYQRSRFAFAGKYCNLNARARGDK